MQQSESVPHLSFAKYACRGFDSIKDAIDHAKNNCPHQDIATRKIGDSWEWYWPRNQEDEIMSQSYEYMLHQHRCEKIKVEPLTYLQFIRMLDKLHA